MPREQEYEVVQRDRGERVPVALEALESSRVELEEDVEAWDRHRARASIVTRILLHSLGEVRVKPPGHRSSSR